MINFSMGQVLSVFPLLRVAFSQKATNNLGVIETLVEFAETSRREGLLALEEKAMALNEPFLEKASNWSWMAQMRSWYAVFSKLNWPF